MKKISDLGRYKKLQARDDGHNGVYDDVSDEQLGEWVKKSSPGDYNDYFDKVTYQKVSELLDFYSPSNGRLTSWWRRSKAGGRIKHLEVINQEMRLVLEQGAMLAEAAINDKKRMVEFEMFLAEHQFALFKMKAEAQLIENALREGLTVDAHQGQLQDRHEHRLKLEDREHKTQQKIIKRDNKTDNEIRILNTEYEWQLKILKETGSEADNQIRIARELSAIKVSEVSQLEAIKLNNEFKLIKEKIKGALISKSIPDYYTKTLVQDLRDMCYTQIEDIRRSNLDQSTKYRMIEDREKHIEFFGGAGKQLLLTAGSNDNPDENYFDRYNRTNSEAYYAARQSDEDSDDE